MMTILLTQLGLDFSLTCPCITKTTIKNGITTSIESIAVFESSKDKNFCKKSKGIDFKLSIVGMPKYKSDMLRYIFMSDRLIKIIEGGDTIDNLYIEGYSYNSKSSSTHKIHEGCQTFKYIFYKKTGLQFKEVSPKTLKKAFTGDGNSGKLEMAEAFKNQYGFYIHNFIERANLKDAKEKSPSADIVDSIALSIFNEQITSLEKKPKKKKVKRVKKITK